MKTACLLSLKAYYIFEKLNCNYHYMYTRVKKLTTVLHTCLFPWFLLKWSSLCLVSHSFSTRRFPKASNCHYIEVYWTDTSCFADTKQIYSFQGCMRNMYSSMRTYFTKHCRHIYKPQRLVQRIMSILC